MDDKKNIIKEFLRLVTTTFTCAVLATSLLGWLTENVVQEMITIFNIGQAGLSHQTIFQLILLSSINSSLALLIGRVFKNKMLLWQLIITMFVCLAATSILFVGFRWLPLASWASWLVFFASFIGLFVIISAILIIKIKIADKQYEKLLSDYKAKQQEENL